MKCGSGVTTGKNQRIQRNYSMTVSNPVSILPSDISVIALQNGVFVSYTEPVDNDWVGTIVALSTSNPPNTTTDRVLKAPGNAYSIVKDKDGNNLLPDTTYYVKVAVYDAFGETGITFSSVYTVTTLQVVEADLADDAVTTNKIEDFAVTDAKINSVTADKITAGTITGSAIQTDAAGSRLILSNSENSLKLYGRLDLPGKSFNVVNTRKYEIKTVDATTDWSSFGGPNPASAGDIFTATSDAIFNYGGEPAYGSVYEISGGTGDYEVTAITSGDEYKISTLTATDWSSVGGGNPASLGDRFIATATNLDISSLGKVLEFSRLALTVQEGTLLKAGTNTRCSVTTAAFYSETATGKPQNPTVLIAQTGNQNINALVVSSASGSGVDGLGEYVGVHGRLHATSASTDAAVQGDSPIGSASAVYGNNYYNSTGSNAIGVEAKSLKGHGVYSTTQSASTGHAAGYFTAGSYGAWSVRAVGGAIGLPSYTVATVPSASSYSGGFIYVSNETGGAIPAFSDGANWRRVSDRAIIA